MDLRLKRQRKKYKCMTGSMAMRKNKDAGEITGLSSSHDAPGDIWQGPAKPLCLKIKRTGGAFK